MGLGIAQVCSSAGYRTLLYDVNPEQVQKALRGIEANLNASVKKGKLSEEEKIDLLNRIFPVTELKELKADLIIEAAVERLDVKKQLFSQLETVNQGKVILATNTSSISVTQIGEGLKDPSACIGLHFFNPADRMKLVEIITSPSTRPEITEAIAAFSRHIGKIAVRAKDSPGFIVNRVARHFYVEALKLLEGKAADVPTIDALIRSSGFRMGPFELMDLIGVDTNLSVTTSVYEGFGRAQKFAPSTIQQSLVKEGRLGRKSGRGFYNYSDEKSG